MMQKRQLALFEKDKTLLEYPVVMKMCTLCHTFSIDIEKLHLILACKYDFGQIHLLSRITLQSGRTNPREELISHSQDIRDTKGLILLIWGRGQHSKKIASQTRAAEQFRSLPSFKIVLAVPTHQSAPEKGLALSRYTQIKARAQGVAAVALSRITFEIGREAG